MLSSLRTTGNVENCRENIDGDFVFVALIWMFLADLAFMVVHFVVTGTVLFPANYTVDNAPDVQ